MCQVDSKRVRDKVVRAYRVYDNMFGVLGSHYMGNPKPKNGVWTKKASTKFHAFAELVFPRFIASDPDCKIYLVELRQNISRGKWDCNKYITTYTADEMRIIKRVK